MNGTFLTYHRYPVQEAQITVQIGLAQFGPQSPDQSGNLVFRMSTARKASISAEVILDVGNSVVVQRYDVAFSES